MVREIHNGLLAAVQTEPNIATLLQVIKCLTILAGTAPYPRLTSGFLTRITSRMHVLLSHQDASIRTAALACLATVMAVKISTPELQSLLVVSDLENADRYSPTQLVTDIINIATTASPFVRVEALLVLSRIATSHTRIFNHLWELISAVLQQCMSDSESRVRLQACKCIEAYTKATATGMNGVVTQQLPSGGAAAADEDEDDSAALQLSETDVKALSELWDELLVKHLPLVSDDTAPLVRASQCNIYSYIPPQVFAHMKV